MVAWDDVKSSGQAVPSAQWNLIVDQIKLKAPIASPTFTGNTTIPAGTNSITISDYRTLMVIGCSVPDVDGATVDKAETALYNDYPYGNFTVAGEGTKNLQWLIDFPDDWNSADGTLGKIQAAFLWTCLAGANDVKWGIAGKLLPNSDPINIALPSIGTVEDTVLTTGDMHVSAYTTAAVVTSVGGGGKTALFKVTRETPAGTDNTSDIQLIGVRIKFIRTLA